MGRKKKDRVIIQMAHFDAGWLKATRLILGLSMEDMAQSMHVTKGTISRIEAGVKDKESTVLLYGLVLTELVRCSTR